MRILVTAAGRDPDVLLGQMGLSEWSVEAVLALTVKALETLEQQQGAR